MDTFNLLNEKRLFIIGDIDDKRTLAADVSFIEKLYQLVTKPNDVIDSQIESSLSRKIFRNALLIINSLSFTNDFDKDGLFQGFMIQYIEENAANEDKDTATERDEVFKLMLLSLTKLRIKEKLLTQTFKDFLNYKLVATPDEEVIQLILKYLIQLTNPKRPENIELNLGYSEFFPHIIHLYSNALVKDRKYSAEIFYIMDNYLEPQSFEGDMLYIREINRLIKPLKLRIVQNKSILAISNYLNYAIKVHGTANQKTKEIQLKFLKQWVLPVLLNDTEKFTKRGSSKINPVSILKKISLEFPSLNKSLIEANLIETFIDYLTTVNINAYLSVSERQSVESIVIEKNISNILMIFSSFAANDEANREAIIRRSHGIVLGTIEDVLRNYMTLKAKLEKHDSSAKLKRLNHELALSALQLLKSLSRSIVSLRKYLVDLKIPSVLIDLSKPYSSFDAIGTLDDDNSNNEEAIDDEMDIDETSVPLEIFTSKSKEENEVISLTLAVLANLILEFSPLRKTFLELGLINIIRLYLEKGSDDEFASIIDFDIKFNSLCVVKHLVFNEKLKFKEDLVIDEISLPVIFGYLKEDIEVQLQDQALNILKNLTSNCSMVQTYKILQYYQSMEIDQVLDNERLNETCLFFKLLINKLQSPKYNANTESYLQTNQYIHEIRETTIYIFAHFLKSNEKLRNILIDNTELLTVIKNILVSNESHDKLKTAAVWFLINLTWLDSSKVHIRRLSTRDRSSPSTSDDDEVMVDANEHPQEQQEQQQRTVNINSIDTETDHALRRLNVLTQMGFKDILRNLISEIGIKLNNSKTSSLSLDLKNRLKTVLSNLEIDD